MDPNANNSDTNTNTNTVKSPKEEKDDKSEKESDSIIDLPRLSLQSRIQNSDLILAILEICTFNKKYNYECSNNTKAFWERVVDEEILKKIFGGFKSETLRKYWKIIRLSGNTEKFINVVKKNERFINRPKFKLLPIINCISAFVQSNKNNFEEFYKNYDPKEKIKEHKENKSEIKLIGTKRNTEDKSGDKKIIFEEEKKVKENIDPKIKELDESINSLMIKTKLSREEVMKALYGTSNNIEHAYLYLTDNKKNDKYYFVQADDYIIKNLRDKVYYKDLIGNKGEELVKERAKFLGITI